MPVKIDIRKVNAFLKQKGLDPAEFKLMQHSNPIRLKRKQKAHIELLAFRGKRVIVYLKGGRYVIRDAQRSYRFQDKALARQARQKQGTPPKSHDVSSDVRQ